MKILLIYLKPNDGLYEIELSLSEIPCDKLILKYFPYPEVYKIAMKTIKEHPEYTHIIWVQNDILFKLEDYKKLCTSFHATGGHILGCSMNVDLSPEGKKLCAFTVTPFDLVLSKPPPYVKLGEYDGIIKVFHNGGVFIVERNFFLQFPLRGLTKAGYNADIEQGFHIYSEGYDYLVNTDIHLKHFRYKGTCMVGKKEPRIEFVKN